ncbi:hypothetical protein [Gossypium barbadense]|uniref:Cytochrome P450 n=1 Tax=Gossypium barbadense TaxID=3634 RepID=A0A5J5NFT6_GOSBA|nr:hypothetical protein [Gossypium barbadense]
MLSILHDAEEHDADTINEGTSLVRANLLTALILAAEDTTSITLTWALSLLFYNRDAMRKVQQELNFHIGKHRLLVTESDTKNLVYLQSIIKETLHLYPAIPLSGIHKTTEDCTINGLFQLALGLFSIFKKFIVIHLGKLF